jgi:hypothetical protein
VSQGPFSVLTGTVTRRDMLGSLVRWSVPTVLTITLAARTAAAASCPPCTKKTGGKCKACTMNQILNCQCEPCLGAPYCSNGVRAPGARPSSGFQAPQSGATPSNPLYSPNGNFLNLNQNQGYVSPFQTTPFGLSPYRTARPYGPQRDSILKSKGSLYDRLRSDQRRPF